MDLDSLIPVQNTLASIDPKKKEELDIVLKKLHDYSITTSSMTNTDFLKIKYKNYQISDFIIYFLQNYKMPNGNYNFALFFEKFGYKMDLTVQNGLNDNLNPTFRPLLSNIIIKNGKLAIKDGTQSGGGNMIYIFVIAIIMWLIYLSQFLQQDDYTQFQEYDVNNNNNNIFYLVAKIFMALGGVVGILYVAHDIKYREKIKVATLKQEARDLTTRRYGEIIHDITDSQLIKQRSEEAKLVLFNPKTKRYIWFIEAIVPQEDGRPDTTEIWATDQIQPRKARPYRNEKTRIIYRLSDVKAILVQEIKTNNSIIVKGTNICRHVFEDIIIYDKHTKLHTWIYKNKKDRNYIVTSETDTKDRDGDSKVIISEYTPKKLKEYLVTIVNTLKGDKERGDMQSYWIKKGLFRIKSIIADIVLCNNQKQYIWIWIKYNSNNLPISYEFVEELPDKYVTDQIYTDVYRDSLNTQALDFYPGIPQQDVERTYSIDSADIEKKINELVGRYNALNPDYDTNGYYDKEIGKDNYHKKVEKYNILRGVYVTNTSQNNIYFIYADIVFYEETNKTYVWIYINNRTYFNYRFRIDTQRYYNGPSSSEYFDYYHKNVSEAQKYIDKILETYKIIKNEKHDLKYNENKKKWELEQFRK